MWATVLSVPPVLRRKITKSERIIDERRSGSGNTPDPDDFIHLPGRDLLCFLSGNVIVVDFCIMHKTACYTPDFGEIIETIREAWRKKEHDENKVPYAEKLYDKSSIWFGLLWLIVHSPAGKHFLA